MNKNQTDLTDLFNMFENIYFKLIFMEAALRGMTGSKMIEEPGLSEGISSVFNSINSEYEIIRKKLWEIIHK